MNRRRLPPRRRNGQFKPTGSTPAATDAKLAAWAPTCELCGGPNGRLPTGSWGCDKHSDWSDASPVPVPDVGLPDVTP